MGFFIALVGMERGAAFLGGVLRRPAAGIFVSVF